MAIPKILLEINNNNCDSALTELVAALKNSPTADISILISILFESNDLRTALFCRPKQILEILYTAKQYLSETQKTKLHDYFDRCSDYSCNQAALDFSTDSEQLTILPTTRLTSATCTLIHTQFKAQTPEAIKQKSIFKTNDMQLSTEEYLALCALANNQLNKNIYQLYQHTQQYGYVPLPLQSRYIALWSCLKNCTAADKPLANLLTPIEEAVGTLVQTDDNILKKLPLYPRKNSRPPFEKIPQVYALLNPPEGAYYSTHQIIGEGTHGRVKMGICVATNRKVVIKTYVINAVKRRIIAQNAESILRERGQLIASLQRVALDQDNQRIIKHQLIMPLAPGKSLYDLIFENKNKKKIPITQQLIYARALMKAVAREHKAGWVHGDLKLEHGIFENDNIELIDWDGGYQYQPHLGYQCIWSPNYNAPELAQADCATIATDIYALGICLARIFSNRARIARGKEYIADLKDIPIQVLNRRMQELYKKMLDNDANIRTQVFPTCLDQVAELIEASSLPMHSLLDAIKHQTKDSYHDYMDEKIERDILLFNPTDLRKDFGEGLPSTALPKLFMIYLFDIPAELLTHLTLYLEKLYQKCPTLKLALQSSQLQDHLENITTLTTVSSLLAYYVGLKKQSEILGIFESNHLLVITATCFKQLLKIVYTQSGLTEQPSSEIFTATLDQIKTTAQAEGYAAHLDALLGNQTSCITSNATTNLYNTFIQISHSEPHALTSTSTTEISLSN